MAGRQRLTNQDAIASPVRPLPAQSLTICMGVVCHALERANLRAMDDATITVQGNGDAFLGKRLLVGITHQTENGEFLRQEQFHGRIVEARDREIIIQRSDTGERISLPPQLQKAPPGEYRLRSTGEIVVNPDYLMTWVQTKSKPPKIM